jgi:hypothetical protein
MAGADDYRRYAMECVTLAQQASDPKDKVRLLQMAQVWRDLADKKDSEQNKQNKE